MELKLRNGLVGLRVRHCEPLTGHGACDQSVHLLFCGRPTEGKRRFRVLTLIGCCHLSGLFAQLSLLACMGVRGPDPNQTDVLEAREQILVFPIPSYRLLRHTLLRPIAVLRRPLAVAGLP